ncbi:hypothetical protein AVEN_97494-1 [Araneus ventricosus]|uniref:Uncharacterized protein n=1 Tax=Araneus ventricosus TaxID=182803 RepID=A0A4Y2NNE4_ARAVE|nr:hypothetical protein AVEN_97494-1 [Araneus ventricosus]
MLRLWPHIDKIRYSCSGLVCKFNKEGRDIHPLTLNTSQFGEVIGILAQDLDMSLEPGKPNQSWSVVRKFRDWGASSSVFLVI